MNPKKDWICKECKNLNYSFRIKEQIFIIPGMENIFYGIRNLKPLEMNCFIKYNLTEYEDFIKVTSIFDKNQYEMYKKRYTLNNYFTLNNTELFMRYGFTIDNNSLDYITYDNISLSCNEYDLKNVILF